MWPGVRRAARPGPRRALRRWCGGALRRRRRAVGVPTHAAGGAQPALGVEQEHARGHDALAHRQPGEDLDAISQLHAERHRSWLEPIAGRDEHVLRASGVDDRVARHGERRGPRQLEDRVAVQARSQRAPGIADRESHPKRARPLGERRVQEVHARRERLTARGGELQARRAADADGGHPGLRDLGQDPDPRQVGNREERRRRIHGRPDTDPAVDDHAAARGDQGHEPLGLAGLFDLGDLRLGHAEHGEACAPTGDDGARDARGGRRAPSRQVLGLRRQQLLREDAGEWLAGSDQFAGGVDVELFHPPSHPRVRMGDTRFVRRHGRDGLDGLRQRLSPDLLDTYPQRLLHGGGRVDWYAVGHRAGGHARHVRRHRRGGRRGSHGLFARGEGPTAARMLDPQGAAEQRGGRDRGHERRDDTAESGRGRHRRIPSYDPTARPRRAQASPSSVSAAIRSAWTSHSAWMASITLTSGS